MHVHVETHINKHIVPSRVCVISAAAVNRLTQAIKYNRLLHSVCLTGFKHKGQSAHECVCVCLCVDDGLAGSEQSYCSCRSDCVGVGVYLVVLKDRK